MPRRGGRERYRTKAQIKRDTKTTTPRPLVLSPRLEAAIRRGGKVVQNVRIVDCQHGIPWTTCTACSKPVRRL